MSAAANLAPALGETFLVVGMGYIAAKFEALPDGCTGAMSWFASYVSLPALIFQALATVKLGTGTSHICICCRRYRCTGLTASTSSECEPASWHLDCEDDAVLDDSAAEPRHQQEPQESVGHRWYPIHLR